MSLVILLSLFGFSASAETRMEQKEAETENTLAGKQSLQRGISFKRLQSAVTTANFFIAISKFNKAYVQHQNEQILLTNLRAASLKFNSFPKPDKLYLLAYPARSADDLLFS